MKKILFLLLICFIKLNAYEYIVYNSGANERIFYDNEKGLLRMKYLSNGIVTSQNLSPGNTTFWTCLSGIKYNYSNYTKKNIFDGYLKNDLIFLNDMYSQATQQTLNYFYNDSSFTLNNHILYENYQILYNEDGLSVESIVDGVWAGLYSDSERGSSGLLYNSSGVLLYVNAEPVSKIQQFLDPLVRSVVGCLMTAVNLIASPVGVVISVVFVMAILYFVVTIGRRAIHPFDGKVRKRFLGKHNEEV